MGIERQMLAIVEEHYKEITLRHNSCQTSSVKADALMNSVHGALRHDDVTDNMVFISSEIRTFGLPNLSETGSRKKKSQADRLG
jgi:hypothetical protein